MADLATEQGALAFPDSWVIAIDAAEKKNGHPPGTLSSLITQEIGGVLPKFIKDPAAFHFEKGADGKRRNKRSGEISTARGLGGVLRGTAKDPDSRTTPLSDKDFQSPEKQIAFIGEYLKNRIPKGGTLSDGLARYGEGEGYANQVLARTNIPSVPVTQETRKALSPIPRPNARNPIPQPNTTTAPPPQRRPGEQDAVGGAGQVPQDNPFNASNPLELLNRDHTRGSNDPFDILNRDHTLGLNGRRNPVPLPAPELQSFGGLGQPNNAQQIQDRLRQTQGTEIII